MRTYGRVYDELSNATWVEVTTDANGFNDMVWVTTLCQVIKLILGEDPFYADYGIPAQIDLQQQIYPDYYVAYIQQKFAPYFAALVVSRDPSAPPAAPVYRINATTHQGVTLNTSVAIPT